MADCCLANLSAIDSAFYRSWLVPEEKLQRSVSFVFKKTRVSHHSLQKTLLTGSVASEIQSIEVCCPLHQSHNDTLPRCFSRYDFSVESEVMMRRVEHLVAHVAIIWIRSIETRSSTMNKQIFQQGFFAVCGLIVTIWTLSSFLKHSYHRSTWANIIHKLTSSMTTSHGVLPAHSIDFQNCTRNVRIRGSDVTKGRWFGFFTSTATTIVCHLQNAWMCASLFQQSHQSAIVTDTVGLASTTGGSDDGMSTLRSMSITDGAASKPTGFSQLEAEGSNGRSSSSAPTRNSNCLSQETAYVWHRDWGNCNEKELKWSGSLPCLCPWSQGRWFRTRWTSRKVVNKLPCESRKTHAQPLTTAFNVFSVMSSKNFWFQLAELSGCEKWTWQPSACNSWKDICNPLQNACETHAVMMLQKFDKVTKPYVSWSLRWTEHVETFASAPGSQIVSIPKGSSQALSACAFHRIHPRRVSLEDEVFRIELHDSSNQHRMLGGRIRP